MDQNRVVESFRDELGLAIETSLRVEPAPELKAQVRARIDGERNAVAPWMPWRLAIGAAITVVIAAIVLAPWPSNRPQDASTIEIAAVHRAALAPYPTPLSQVAAVANVPDLARATTAQSTISSQAAALNAYIAQLRRHDVDPATLAAATTRPSSEPLKLSNINIERIAIEALPKLDAIAGERQ